MNRIWDGTAGLGGGPPMGFDEIMIVNPAGAGHGRALMFGDVYEGYGQVPEEPLGGFDQGDVELRAVGDVFLGADGNLYEVAGAGGYGPLGEVVLGDDGALYEAVGVGQAYVPRPEPLEALGYYGQVSPEEAMSQAPPEEVGAYWGQIAPEEPATAGWYGQAPAEEVAAMGYYDQAPPEDVAGYWGQVAPEEVAGQVAPEDVSGFWGQAPPEEVLQGFDQAPADESVQGYVSVPFQPDPGEVPGQTAYRPAYTTRSFPSDIFRPHF